MTAPVPNTAPAPDSGTVTRAFQSMKDMPRWGWVAVAIGGGLVAYYLIWKPASNADGSTGDDSATDGATSTQKYDTPQRTWPRDPSYNVVTNPGPGAPHGGGASPGYGYNGGQGNTASTNPNDTTDGGTDAPVGTWAIPSMGYGWTSTLRGIAQNFYGSAEYAQTLLQYNQGKVANTWSQIPAGTVITVPRQKPAISSGSN